MSCAMDEHWKYFFQRKKHDECRPAKTEKKSKNFKKNFLCK